MQVIPLSLTSSHHTSLVVSLVVQSMLDYGDIDHDARLLAWYQRQGAWAVAVNQQRLITGIVAVVKLSDMDRDALFWLEVRPDYRQRGYGRALLNWANQHARQPLVIRSVVGAYPFYERLCA
ncbi:MAG: GNAT family N-acetyltransferase [Chloroflexaceae bacterium]|nr:GNAT family N-acetyltransferase [Chloroflexaceae bacterium]